MYYLVWFDGGIIGQFFLNEANKRALTVNWKCYKSIFFVAWTKKIYTNDCYIQEYGVTTQITPQNIVMGTDYLNHTN